MDHNIENYASFIVLIYMENILQILEELSVYEACK